MLKIMKLQRQIIKQLWQFSLINLLPKQRIDEIDKIQKEQKRNDDYKASLMKQMTCLQKKYMIRQKQNINQLH